MSLEKIIEKIHREVQQEAEAAIRRAEEEAARILARAEQEAREQARQIIEKATRAAQAKSKRMTLSADLIARKEILIEKNQAIRSCYQGVLEKLNQMSDQAYLEIIKKMLLAGYTPDMTEVVFSEKDKGRVNQHLIDQVNKILQERGHKGQLKLSREHRDIEGGFILKGNRIEINNSFSAILKYQQSDLEAEIARTLFGEM